MTDEKLSFTQKLRKENEIITDIQELDIQKSQQINTTTQDDIDDDAEKLPIILIPNTILLPHTVMTLNLDKAHADKILSVVNDDKQGIILSPKRLPNADAQEVEFYDIGVILEIKDLSQMPEEYLVELKVKDKVEVTKITEQHGVFYGTYQTVAEEDNITPEEAETINESINATVQVISGLIPNSGEYANKIIEKQDTQTKVAEVFPYLKTTLAKKQELLEMESTKLRALKVTQLLVEQKDAMLLQVEIAKKLNENMTEAHKQNLLREQMKMIQEELNMTQDEESETKTYRERIMEAKLPEKVEKAALKEVVKLERQGQNNSEENIIRNYLDTILELPWHKEEKTEIDLIKAREQLDKDHYGLDKIKDRIIEHLAVLKLKGEKQGSILLFVGPPGTGKTSLGRSIADALNRPYIRASLGGIKDESEIRGHRRTYLGAMPGRIIRGMQNAGKSNPVFVLDEVDKMTESINGNPTSALLEVLDPEQNDSFSDHYLEVGYDLSDVFFVATANSLDGIPGPLRDRLEIINLDSYTANEKRHIAEEHLIDDVLDEHGLTRDDITITTDAVDMIIEKYTREAGVRGLKREIATIARKIAQKIIEDDGDESKKPYIVDKDDLHDLLGHEKAHYDKVDDENPAGVVTGLAWTPVGGDVLFIESIMTPGEGKLKLTGQLGDVMKESAQIAQSLVKSRLADVLKDSSIDEKDIHIHVPEGAIKKDGPSAGVTLLTAITSLITGISVDSKIAMTGEISLQGKVLPVGGIKEKVIAAHRAGIKKVLLPCENEKDLEDVPDEIKDELTFKFMHNIDEVLLEALNIKIPENKKLDIKQDALDAMKI